MPRPTSTRGSAGITPWPQKVMKVSPLAAFGPGRARLVSTTSFQSRWIVAMLILPYERSQEGGNVRPCNAARAERSDAASAINRERLDEAMARHHPVHVKCKMRNCVGHVNRCHKPQKRNLLRADTPIASWFLTLNASGDRTAAHKSTNPRSVDIVEAAHCKGLA